MAANHYVTVIDFVDQGSSIYIQVEVFDAKKDQHFREEVRFLDDLLYGELVHPSKSPLSEPCRLMMVEYLRKHFGR
ncbi:hypothetical protein [Planomicrobium sp. CPCC 101079]|uniref:hypothetical protein n=1 Tax=Planomicrobium sp. CPCC 101079 TaxID=2599618 RepID=UPI0011B66D1B|nr:hypothetical protein [Planomicrobium sp. CPCC 101079]TWT02421.1 hypothetical protein FQV28_13325 [Planomicrobium sp. CPCC 101079]